MEEISINAIYLPALQARYQQQQISHCYISEGN